MEENNYNFEQHEEQPLTKEEIFKRSQNENKKGDEFYKENMSKSLKFGVIFSLFFFVAIFIAEQILSNQVVVAPAVFSVMWAISGGANLFNGILNKKKAMILIGILGIVTAILAYVTYIGCLLHFN